MDDDDDDDNDDDDDDDDNGDAFDTLLHEGKYLSMEANIGFFWLISS